MILSTKDHRGSENRILHKNQQSSPKLSPKISSNWILKKPNVLSFKLFNDKTIQRPPSFALVMRSWKKQYLPSCYWTMVCVGLSRWKSRNQDCKRNFCSPPPQYSAAYLVESQMSYTIRLWGAKEANLHRIFVLQKESVRALLKLPY